MSYLLLKEVGRLVGDCKGDWVAPSLSVKVALKVTGLSGDKQMQISGWALSPASRTAVFL